MGCMMTTETTDAAGPGRGTRPRALRDYRYSWAWLFGGVCPECAVGAAVVLPEVNVDAMDTPLPYGPISSITFSRKAAI
jgi:hypothetical protein